MLKQTYSNFEIILFDDGSNSPEINATLLNYSAKYPDRFTVVINRQNLKVGMTRNIGINLAKGKYIAFLDSDDYSPLDRI